MTKASLLFVDDEPKVLDGLRRMLRSTRDEWDCYFAASGKEALEKLDQGHFDVVVSDMRMPEMDGAQLLQEVESKYPRIIRIILSGQCDEDAALLTIQASHQFLAKPSDRDTIVQTVKRALALRDMLSSPKLQSLVAGLKFLPSLPQNYAEFEKVLNSPNASTGKIGEVILKDVALTVRILQVANSAYFGTGRQVSTPAQAVARIGTDIIGALILSEGVFTQLEESGQDREIYDGLAEHSLSCAALAEKIARSEKLDTEAIRSTFVAGLLHDVGVIVLNYNLPDEYAEAMAWMESEGVNQCEAEQHILGASHDAIGAYLAGLWGLPNAIIEAIAFHHHPTYCHEEKMNALTAVHVAEGLFDYSKKGGADDSPDQYMDAPYLYKLGVLDRLPAWLAILEELQSEEAAA